MKYILPLKYHDDDDVAVLYAKEWRLANAGRYDDWRKSDQNYNVLLAAYAAHRVAEAQSQAYDYAKSLAIALHKHYPENTVWRPADDLITVLTQIDNATAGLSEKMAEKDRQIKMLELKAANSLANNLCPDHRDKQAGKPCLACTIEQKDAEIARLRKAVRALLDCPAIADGELNHPDWGCEESAKAESFARSVLKLRLRP